MTEQKPYFRLSSLSEEDVAYWLQNGYKLVAVVPIDNGSWVRCDYHFVHRDYT